MVLKFKFDAPQSRKKPSQSREQSVELVNARIGRIEKKKERMNCETCCTQCKIRLEQKGIYDLFKYASDNWFLSGIY